MSIISENIGGNNSGTNSGYVIELILIDVKDVDNILDPIYFGDATKPMTVLNGNVEVNIDAKVYRIKFRTKSCGFTEALTSTMHGKAYNPNIDFDLPKVNKDLSAWLHKNRNRKWIALYKDANDCCYISGEPDFGLQLSMGRKISSATNSTGVSLAGVYLHQSWFLESLDINLLSQSTFNNDFSEDFEVGY